MSTLTLAFAVPSRQTSFTLAHLKESLVEWRRRVRSRAELMSLSDHTLQDIGVSRCDAHYESSKPFWVA